MKQISQSNRGSDLASIRAAILDHLNTAEVIRGHRYPVPAIECADGSRMSVQAGEYLYCTPRRNTGPWTQVEVLWLSSGSSPRNWEVDDLKLGAYVDIDLVALEILERGCRLDCV